MATRSRAKTKSRSKSPRAKSLKTRSKRTKKKVSRSSGRTKTKRKKLTKTKARKKTIRSASKARKTTSPRTPLSKSHLLEAFKQALRARLCDHKAIVLYKQNKCHFQIGVEGHEIVQVAAANVFEAKKDWFYPYYREMALVTALGQTSKDLMLNAMNRQDDPNSHGRQMPMHYGSVELNIVNQSSPTGTQFNQAVGCALSSKKLGLDEVTYVSVGEGSCSQGDFHEALNWAARDKLPIIFLVQNNDFAISVHVSEQLAGESVAKIASGYENLESVQIDGTDYVACYKTIKKLYDRAKKGKGPAVIEAMVPRLQSHSISDNHLKYRSEEEIAKERKRCPIEKFKRYLIRNKVSTKKQLREIEEEIKQEVDQAAEWAEAQATPDPARAIEHTYSDPDPSAGVVETNASGAEIYMVDALNHALKEELVANPDTYIFGQDVAGGKGGVFTVTAGLTDQFGKERVFNSQLAESSIVGVAIGMATRGLKPIAEIQFGDYVWTATMAIRNELAMMHYRSGGDFSCPAVIRIPIGGYIHGGPYHSQNIEATMAHFSGLYIILPSNATDAKGLLKSAIRCNNPVLFLEHKGLYRQVYAKGPEGGSDYLTPIGKAKVVREGQDATIVTWGALVQKSLLAAEAFEADGISVEVIDLRTIVPLDFEAIRASVQKTNRVLIAHEDTLFMGFGAEIAAQIASNCFEYLDAPIKRLGMPSVACVAHSPVLEEAVLPQTDDLIQALGDLLTY